MMSLKDRVILVAGATGNLGEAVARRFHATGASLILLDREMGRIESIYADLAGEGRHLLVECTDMTEPKLVEASMRVIRDRFDRLDVFVTAVGGYRAGEPLHETPVSTFDFMLNLNARTFYIGARAVVPEMIRQGSGKVIAVGARPGLKGRRNAGAYSAAKGALIRLVESMADELKDSGINVNCVVPGTLDTPENREATPEADHSTWVSMESVADVIVFLASDAARDIHGACIPVYGRS